MRPNLRLQIGITVVALTITGCAWFMLNVDLYSHVHEVLDRAASFKIVAYPYLSKLIEITIYGLVINLLLYGSFVFILTRLGYLQRERGHRPATYEELAHIYDISEPPALTILIPSYKEEPDIVFRTLLSAALLEYPRRRVVLLIDDPPTPRTESDQALLAAARQLPVDVANLLRPLAKELATARYMFELRQSKASVDVSVELVHLAKLSQNVARWFEEQARLYPALDHAAEFFVEQILLEPAKAHRQQALELLALSLEEQSPQYLARLNREYRRLSSIFDVQLDSFERKKYENLSHESNKAMNLNSYIGLTGGNWRSFQHGEKTYLQEMPPGQGDLRIPAADYIITLDADSLLVNDYALRLIHEMRRPAHQRTAIIQTPYSAFPGAAVPLEIIAGAQTDMQYVVHQGFTQHKATFWVGANALLRKKALDEIVLQEEDRGHMVNKYIQDRTVIEDTESSIDLVESGWHLFNYPARLAYSATPPDFGTLLIQRRRWANGGLIIFPKMVRYVFSSPGRLRRLPEGFLRSHYLISSAMTNLGLLILILYGFNFVMLSPWLLISVFIYFFIYALSLKEAGYQRRDLLRVWALNLLLIPVNLAGAFKSVQQALTGQRGSFARTPKVEHRTASPAWLVLFEIVLAIYCLAAAAFDLYDRHWLDSGFGALNGIILIYAITVFIGWSNALEDIRLAFKRSPTQTSQHD